jgi:tRNA (guanosine-2'-O-)-methyltransferase
VACAVTLYEAYRQKSNAGHYDKMKLEGNMLNELLEQWGFEEDENGL